MASKQAGRAGRTSRNAQEFPGVSHYRDRHGKLRWRYRAKGFTVNLGRDYGSTEFIRRYNAAVKGERLSASEAAGSVSQAPPGSLASVIRSWYQSAEFRRLADTTAANYRRVAEALMEDHGHRPANQIDRSVVKRLMAKKVETPEAANALLRILRLVLDHAVETMGIMETNPARSVKKFESRNKEGFYTWTEEDIEKYRQHHAEGTMPDLAMTLMLCTGAARVDAVQLGWDNVSDGRLKYRRQKMKSRDGVLVDIPVHEELQRRLDAIEDDRTTFLETETRKQRSSAGLGNAMRKWADAAGLPDCTAHGLRKACARRLAEAGATPHEIMAVTGHKTLAEVERYTEKVARAGLADRAMEKRR